jgi:hypothetical protein
MTHGFLKKLEEPVFIRTEQKVIDKEWWELKP